LPVENVLPNRLPKTAAVPRRSNMSALPFFYFNRWLIRKLKPSENLGKMFLYYLIILPIAFVLITLCIYIILRGYLLIQRD